MKKCSSNDEHCFVQKDSVRVDCISFKPGVGVRFAIANDDVDIDAFVRMKKINKGGIINI